MGWPESKACWANKPRPGVKIAPLNSAARSASSPDVGEPLNKLQIQGRTSSAFSSGLIVLPGGVAFLIIARQRRILLIQGFRSDQLDWLLTNTQTKLYFL